MSDDRLAQARAEAVRRYPPRHGVRLAYTAHQVDKHIASAFVSGAMWADAHPQPRTITRHDLRAMVDAQADAGMTGGWVSLDDMMTAALDAIGIGVAD